MDIADFTAVTETVLACPSSFLVSDIFKFAFVYPTLFPRDKIMCPYYSCEMKNFL
jgi:hypothetical protein